MIDGKTKHMSLDSTTHKGTCSLKKFGKQYEPAHLQILHIKLNTK